VGNRSKPLAKIFRGVLTDRAYEGNETQNLAEGNGRRPVVPPKSNRKARWEYGKNLNKSRNIVERFFSEIKEFRQIFARYDKLDEMFLSYIYIAIIAIWLH
jgi:transposase